MTTMANQRATAPPCAIVVGLDSMQGLQVARLLDDRGVTVIGVANNGDYHATATNACVAVLEADTGSRSFISMLQSMAEHFASPPVLVPCQDKNVLSLSRHRDDLQGMYRLLLPDDDVVRQMADKESMYEFAALHGFQTPQSYTLRSTEDVAEAVAAIRYPCLLKPFRAVGSWTQHTTEKALVARDAAELTDLYEQCHSWADVLIAQEWIEGEDDTLISCNAYFDASGACLTSFVARKIRQWPPHTGKSASGAECRDDEVLSEAMRFFAACNMKGLGYVEFKRSATTGELYLIEPNLGRPTGRSAIAEAGGVELHYTMYCDVAGEPIPDARTQRYGDARWVNLLRDVQSAIFYRRTKGLTIRQWAASLKGPRAYALWSYRDPKPFLLALAAAIREISSGGSHPIPATRSSEESRHA